MRTNSFKCETCKNRFVLHLEDWQDYKAGKFTEDPDTCYKCLDQSTKEQLTSTFL